MAPTLTGAVAVRQEDGTTRVVLSFTGNAEFSTFLLSNPQRLVVDVPNGAVAPDAVNTSDGLVSKITTARVEEDGGLLRVTLFLSARATFEAKPEGGRIVVTLRSGQTDDPLAEGARGDVDGNGIRLSEPQQVIPGPVLTSLDYQQRERMGVVVLGLKDVEAVVSMPSSRQIVVDLPGAAGLHEALLQRVHARVVRQPRQVDGPHARGEDEGVVDNAVHTAASTASMLWEPSITTMRSPRARRRSNTTAY
jgi:hypothetical protein